MINKLRLSTAIIGSLAGLGLSAAVAQTTVSGNVAMGFIATSTDNTNKNGSWSSMSKETQINIGTKGKLNNGMNYAAGFSLEYDGPDTGSTAMYAEGNYIEISSGDTTLTIGADRIQNGDRHVTNAVGIGYIGQDGLGAEPQQLLRTQFLFSQDTVQFINFSELELFKKLEMVIFLHTTFQT